MLHLGSPLQESPQVFSFPPHEFPELQEANLRHFDAAVSFNAPEEVRTTPREQAVSTGGIPKKTQDDPHGSEYSVVVQTSAGPLSGLLHPSGVKKKPRAPKDLLLTPRRRDSPAKVVAMTAALDGPKRARAAQPQQTSPATA